MLSSSAFIHFIYCFIYFEKELTVALWCQQLSPALSLFFNISCSKHRLVISIQEDSCWRHASICVAGQVPLCSSFYLWGRIHGRLSSECDKWNCVINLASRFNVLRDAQRLLSSPCTSIRICQRNVQENRDIHPSLSVFFPLPHATLFLSPASFQGWATGSSWGLAQVEAWLQPGPLAE